MIQVLPSLTGAKPFLILQQWADEKEFWGDVCVGLLLGDGIICGAFHGVHLMAQHGEQGFDEITDGNLMPECVPNVYRDGRMDGWRAERKGRTVGWTGYMILGWR